jgi:hypothetical protein
MKASPMVWTGRVLSALFVLFMLGASVAPKFLMPYANLDYFRSLNIDPADVPLIGVVELIGTLLYAWRRTSLLGAVIMTGLLGGAIATHLHVDSPLFSHTLFGVYLGLIMWAGLWLRDAQVRAVLPLLPSTRAS